VAVVACLLSGIRERGVGLPSGGVTSRRVYAGGSQRGVNALPRMRDVRCHVFGSSEEQLRKQVKELRAREIIDELKEYGVNTNGIIEKEELVGLLVSERLNRSTSAQLKDSLKQAEDILNTAGNKVTGSVLGAINAVKSFDIQEEIEKTKATIKDQVDWAEAGTEFDQQKRFIKRQRGYRKGGDDLSS